MNNILLIHGDNVPSLDNFDNRIKFEVDSSGLDAYISNEIIEEMKTIEFDIVCIKDSLSSNYLELYGLRLAYHIRLSQELGNIRFVPIVILSDLDSYLLNKITPMARIFFSKNIFIAPNKIKSIKALKEKYLHNMDENDYRNNFLNYIEIEVPQESHHDIANEWSIYRWAEFLQIKDSEKINRNKDKIASMLYFKYLLEKYPVPEKRGLRIIPKTPTSNGKILYIDDEWNSGWQDIFSKYFSEVEKITFKTIEKINKDTKYDKLKEFINEHIISYDPDLVILDMRLISDDHQEDIDEKNISGIKLLKYIKEEINPGIQVIMLTASGRSLILDEANKYDILGYIKKEHPEDRSTNTKDNFTKLKELIDCGLDKKYLKQVWQLQNDVLSLDMFRNDKYNQIKLEVRSIFEILNSSMENKFIYAMFSLYKIIEIIINLYIYEKKEYGKRFAYWIDNNQKIKKIDEANYPKITDNHSNDSTENKIRMILHEKLSLANMNIHNGIHEFVQKRNNTIHPNKSKSSLVIDDSDILEWFKMIYSILSKLSGKC